MVPIPYTLNTIIQPVIIAKVLYSLRRIDSTVRAMTAVNINLFVYVFVFICYLDMCKP